MKNLAKFFTLLIFLCPLTTISSTLKNEVACTKFITQYRYADTGIGGHELHNKGTYCLKENISVKWNSSWITGHTQISSDSVETIYASDTVLDLNGNTISGDGGLSAAVDSPYDKDGGITENPPSNITVRNGTILIERHGAGIMFFGLGGDPMVDVPEDMSDAWIARDGGSHDILLNKESVDLAVRSFDRELKNPQPNKFSDYPARHILIENMKITIKSDKAAIMVQGAGTVIRKNFIEVDGGTAIWIGGPNAVIENNTLIIHGRKNLLSADAPIRLKYGDGAIIRNNKIIIKDKANRRVVSTFNSGNFVFENNTIYGLDKTDMLAKAFLGALKMKAKANLYEPNKKAILMGVFDKPQSFNNSNLPNFKEGKWDISTSVQMNGEPVKNSPTASAGCIQPTKLFERDIAGIEKTGCKYSLVSKVGTEYRYKASCNGSGAKQREVQMILQAPSADEFTEKIITETGSSILVARRVNDC